MQKLIAFVVAIPLTTTIVSASTLFAPDPSTASNSPSSPPTSYTAGTPYTQTIATDGGTITYSPTSFTVGDTSTTDQEAYITSTESVAHTDIINTTLTFTANYTNADPTGSVGGQTNVTLLTLEPLANANNDVLSVTLQTLGYGSPGTASVLVDTGIAFGGGTKTGPQEYTSSGVDSLSGVTLTLKLTQVFVTDQHGTSTVTTTGTLSDAANTDLYNYDYVVATNTNGYGYDPANDYGNGGLILDAGLIRTGNNPGFADPGATVTLSDISIVSVPEPTTYAMPLGALGAMLLLGRRARRQMTA